MRIVVTGTSGSGKTTMARTLAARLAMPHIELDAINWQPGWRDLNRHDPAEFRRRVALASEPECWVADGSYFSVIGDILWPRASHLVWLDYDRPVIMARVIGRSLLRALDRRELWPSTGNREDWRQWLHASHPIRWAWSTWSHRRTATLERLADPAHAHLTVFRLRRPREARPAIEALVAARNHGTIPSPGRSSGGGAP